MVPGLNIRMQCFLSKATINVSVHPSSSSLPEMQFIYQHLLRTEGGGERMGLIGAAAVEMEVVRGHGFPAGRGASAVVVKSQLPVFPMISPGTGAHQQPHPP